MDGQNTAFFFFALTLHNYLSSTARITIWMVKIGGIKDMGEV